MVKFREEYTFYLIQSLKNGEKEKFREDLKKLHPTDQLNFFITLDKAKRDRIYDYLAPEEFAEIFQGLNLGHQKELFTELEESYRKGVLKNMNADNLADLLGALSKTEATIVLNALTAFTDREEVSEVIKKYDLLAVPVTIHGKLVGIITVDDIIDMLEEEATEDIGEISAAKGAVDININSIQAAKSRLPWLILLLFIGMLTAFSFFVL